MDNLREEIKNFLEKNQMTIDEFSKNVKIDNKNLENLMLDKYTPTDEEVSAINKYISSEKSSSSKRLILSL